MGIGGHGRAGKAREGWRKEGTFWRKVTPSQSAKFTSNDLVTLELQSLIDNHL